MTILFAPEAETDFRRLVEYLSARNPTGAARLADRVFSVIDQLAAGDFDGPEHVLATGERVRSWAVPPIRIYFQRRPGALWMIRFHHQSRSPI